MSEKLEELLKSAKPAELSLPIEVKKSQGKALRQFRGDQK